MRGLAVETLSGEFSTQLFNCSAVGGSSPLGVSLNTATNLPICISLYSLVNGHPWTIV